MKTIIIFYILLIVLAVIVSVFSHSSHKIRLYDVIRGSVGKRDRTLLLEVRPRKTVYSTTIPPFEQQADTVTDEEEIKIQTRDSWDSDEDHYYKWASMNRRPMESLVGRKRSIETNVIETRHSRINGGVWSSGIVG